MRHFPSFFLLSPVSWSHQEYVHRITVELGHDFSWLVVVALIAAFLHLQLIDSCVFVDFLPLSITYRCVRTVITITLL